MGRKSYAEIQIYARPDMLPLATSTSTAVKYEAILAARGANTERKHSMLPEYCVHG